MITRRVLRYRLDITDTVDIALPAGAVVLSVGPPRDGTDQLDMWAEVAEYPGLDQERRSFRVVGTGNPMPDDCGRFVGTVPLYNGQLIFHVFEAGAR